MPTSIAAPKQQQAPHVPPPCHQSTRPRNKNKSVLWLLRGPIIWLCGTSILLSCSIVLWDYLSSLRTSVVPLFVVTLFMLVAIWTFSCGVIVLKDCCDVLIYPYMIKPAIAGASKYSIDEVLTILCDPTQLAAYLSAVFVVPVTLYTLPTTPAQRAQILLSTLFPSATSLNITIEDNSNSSDTKRIFTEAGGWKYLLPKSLQKIVDDSNNNTTVDSYIHPGQDRIQFKDSVFVETGELFHDIGNTSTEDEDESNDEEHIVKASSVNEPMFASTNRRGTVLEESVDPPVPCNNEPKSSTTSSSKNKKENSEEMDVSNLFFKILFDVFDNKFQSACQRLERHQSTMVLTAITTFTILALQFRTSPTARTIFKSGVHILLTTTSSVTLIASLVALLTPYLHQRLVHQLLTHGSNREQKDEICRWSTAWFSFLQNNFSIISNIPKSIPTPRMKKNIHLLLSKWKGALAICLLTYFQYRYRKSMQPRRFNNTS